MVSYEEPQIESILCMAKLGCIVDLRHIVMSIPNSIFCKDRVILRIRNPFSTFTLFTDGQIRCVGSRNENFAKLAMRRIARKVQNAGYDVRVRDFTIQSLTGKACIGFELISLSTIVDKYEYEGMTYDPSVFAGIVYQNPTKFRVSVQIFKNGKITFLGSKSKEDMYNVFGYLYKILQPYRQLCL